ncbi:MAG: hypothetical protein ACR2JA_20690 [Hydrogenophaga sp.]|uniref:hypothetical protein n=1 Tax=Hydrogenophaga sp. TaxID=1904254 RepID=UPI003D9AD2C7
MSRTLAPRHPLLAAMLALCASAALAQAALPPAAPAPADATEPRIERIQHEDALTRVDELRVAGQTRSITVQPKNGAPAYDVAPATGGEDPNAARNGSTGKSRWRLLDF